MAVNSRRFQLDWDHRHTCHTIHHTQCKQTIHVHNWDIYGIFCGCHVNPWNNQAIKSCCQQAKTAPLQKNSSCWHENTFIISRLFFFQLALATRKKAVLKFEVSWIEMLHFLTWIYYFISPLSNSLGFERIHSDFFWTQFESLLLKFVSWITEKVQLIGMGQAL